MIVPSNTNSESAGTSRSTVLHLANGTPEPPYNPANNHSDKSTGIGVAAAIIIRGSTPRAIATSNFLPRSAALRKCLAPPRTDNQCTVMVWADCSCKRYTPTLGVPVTQSLVITNPKVIILPASPG